jgi:alpha-mannosidase
MASPTVTAALDRLRAAADRVFAGFPATHWTVLESNSSVTLNGGGGFEGLAFEPGRDVTLQCALDLPSEACGVALAGDPLEATLFSLYPCEIVHDGALAFGEEGVPVAAGPALFTLIPVLKPGANGALEVRIHIPNNQTTPWFNLKLTTPGLRARFEALDIAWARLALADEFAATAAQKQAVEDAAALVPAELDGDGAALQDALDRMAAQIAGLASEVANVRVHLVGHSHIDMNWLWTWDDTRNVIIRDFRSVLALMEEFPELTFSHSQPATYEVIRREEPELFAQVLRRIREKRWELFTTSWVEGDVNMASGEALARQVLQGVRYSREVLGASPCVFHDPDTFGHAGNLPQIAASAGARFYYHHRANPGQENQWPAYWWEGQDGTRILGISTPSYNGDIHARDLAYAAIKAHQYRLPVGLHFHGIGDHGGGPSRQNLLALRRFQKTLGLPSAFCSSLEAYGEEVLRSGAPLPVWRGESSTIFEGCYTTHADTKRYNRAAENLLNTADALAAVAGLDRTDELTPAWRTVCFNQFHDIFDGSAIHEVYEKNREDFDAVQATAAAVTDEALKALAAHVARGRVVVTNPLGVDREDWVVVEELAGSGALSLVGPDGHRVLGQRSAAGLGFVARVPAFGSVSYEPVEDAPGAPEDLKATDAGIYLKVETPTFRAAVRKDCGILVSLFDKRVGRELVGFGMRRASDYVDTARPDLALNVFQVTDEAPHGMTAWQLNEVHTEHSLLSGATTTIVEQGPARIVLQVEHRVRASAIVERICFYRDLPRIDFDAEIDWQEVGSGEVGVPGLKVAFTAHLPECEAWFETPFGAVRRPADGLESPALRWADAGGPEYGIAVLNDCKYGHDILGCRVRVTLIRSAYDPDAFSDRGLHRVRFSLVPHVGSWQDAGVVQAAAGFNQPLLGTLATGEGGAEPARFRPRLAGAPGVQIASLKTAADGTGFVVRLYEATGRTGTVALAGLPPGAPVWETNLVEDRIGALPNNGGRVELAFRPWQVRTVLVETA